jgi:hypothetical protein
MHIGMRKSTDQPARPAASAGLIVRLLAQKQLSQPEGQPLLPYAGRPSQEEYLGKLASGVRSSETLPRHLVADQRTYRLRTQGKQARAEW